MKSFTALVILAGLLAGCDYRPDRQDLQQEKLVLELMQTQRAQLAELVKKEKDEQILEKKNEAAAQDIARQRAAQESQRKEIDEKRKAAEMSIAREKGALSAVQKRLADESKAIEVREARNRHTEQELAAKRTSLLALERQIESQERAGPELAKELASQRAEQAKQQEAEEARVKARRPALDQLAATTAGLFDSPNERAVVRGQLLDLFKCAEVAKIKDDDLFVLQARGLAESYYLNRIKFPYLDIEKSAFDSWAEQNLKHARVSMTPLPRPQASNRDGAF